MLPQRLLGRLGDLRSTGETAAIEERLLFRRGRAAEYGVAVGKPSKTPDDVGVDLRPFEIFRVPGGFIESDATLLVGEVFGMLKREIEEIP